MVCYICSVLLYKKGFAALLKAVLSASWCLCVFVIHVSFVLCYAFVILFMCIRACVGGNVFCCVFCVLVVVGVCFCVLIVSMCRVLCCVGGFVISFIFEK